MAARSVRAGEAAQPEPAPDLSILITMVLQNAVLFGPPPAQLLDPVPHDDLIRGAVAGIPHLLSDLESDTRNVLLTLARIWTTLQTGQLRSKDAAAAGRWSSFHLSTNRYSPSPGHVPRRRGRGALGGPPAVRAHAEYVVQTIGQSARS